MAVLKFFETSTRNLLAAEADAGVGHHVALSVVGTDRLLGSGYLRAKTAQETLIKASPIPYSIVRATQFFILLTQRPSLLAVTSPAPIIRCRARCSQTINTVSWFDSPVVRQCRWCPE
jgi:uncharacterized protein YbjT (DUF2867 family)